MKSLKKLSYRRRGGGYNLDAGSSELMIKGEIGLLQNETIERYCPEGESKEGRLRKERKEKKE